MSEQFTNSSESENGFLRRITNSIVGTSLVVGLASQPAEATISATSNLALETGNQVQQVQTLKNDSQNQKPGENLLAEDFRSIAELRQNLNAIKIKLDALKDKKRSLQSRKTQLINPNNTNIKEIKAIEEEINEINKELVFLIKEEGKIRLLIGRRKIGNFFNR
jgi:SMC interacting uncharacterized protein involved in chromosome segregation